MSGLRVLAVLLATATIAHSSCRKSEKAGPSEGVPEAKRPLAQPSRELSSAFFVGTAALQTGDFPRAEAELTKATQLAPGEAAAWANLALLEARKAGTAPSPTAESALEKARALVPGEPLVARLRGLYAISRGRTAEAQTALREAGGDPLAKWTLAQSLLASDPKEARKLASELVTAFPANLAVRLGAARFADGDAAAIAAALPPADALPAQAAEARADVLNAVDADARRRALQILRNTLLPEREFQRDLAEIETGTGEIAPPIGRLLAHETPPAQPAVPDRELSLDRKPLPGVTGPWQMLEVFRPDGTSAPVFVLSDGKKTRLPGGKEIAFGAAHVLAVDLDADFLVDLVLGGPTGLRVLKREAAGGFTQAASPLPIKAVTALVACDLDADGDLDVVAGTAGPTLALLNDGSGRLRTTDLFAGTEGLAEAVVVDLDGDADADLVMRRSDGRVEIQRNERLLRYERLTRDSDPPAVALAVLDADGDGTLDVATLGRDGSLAMLAALSSRVGISRTPLANLGHGVVTGARLFAEDVDHNGAVDLLASAEGAASGSALWLANEKLAFERLDLPLPFTGGVALLDLDGDGPLDLVSREGAVYAVRLTRDYGVKTIRARARTTTGDRRINSYGLLGEVEARAGLLSVTRPIASPAVRIGLGKNPRLDVVRVFWPNGTVQAEFGLPADDASAVPATFDQRLEGSCPYVFTWNGKAIEFVTDFLWRSPLGLRINAQVTAGVVTTEDWVMVRGDRLTPKDGFYDLRITTELWESQFFDHVALLVADHPVGTSLFVDERFVIPPPPFAARLASPPQPVVRATDDQGRDVTGLVGERDGRYVDGFSRGPYQGVTRPHYLEVELPEDVPVDGRLGLLANGWIHPTDSSINVALSQSAEAPPRPLEISVSDGTRFRVLHANAGFPEGKHKTVFIDLKGAWKGPGPRRVRLATNLEVYWDEVRWTVEKDDAPRIQRLAPATVELRYRGFSVKGRRDESSPELPTYDRLLATLPRRHDLIGFYTRFGDVGELLAKVDDRYVLMNAGDEMAFRFAAPAPPPPGFVRDFVLVGDGWVKDGNLGTVFSKTLLPLPAHGVPESTRPPGRLEDDPVYRAHAADWQTFHTRWVGADAVRSALARISPRRAP